MTKNELFTNSIIKPENLPVIEQEQFNPIDPSYLKLIYIRLVIITVVFALAGFGFFEISKDEFPMFSYWIMGGLFLLIIIYSFFITRLSFKFRGYLIREKDIAYQRGLIQYKLTSIPFIRMQHVELSQGLLEKKMNLASIQVYTAGGSGEDLKIRGLTLEVAKHIRAFLSNEISSDGQS